MRRKALIIALFIIWDASTANSTSQESPVVYSQETVDKIRRNSSVPYPSGVTVRPKPSDSVIVAIILHSTRAPDAAISFLRSGRLDLPGPGAHWAVLSDGSVAFVADEMQKVNHLGRAGRGLRNDNTIAIESIGMPAFSDARQVESLVRLVADVANRWGIPTNMIFSHAEVFIPSGRKNDMLQQAPAIRKMVDAVRRAE